MEFSRKNNEALPCYPPEDLPRLQGSIISLQAPTTQESSHHLVPIGSHYNLVYTPILTPTIEKILLLFPFLGQRQLSPVSFLQSTSFRQVIRDAHVVSLCEMLLGVPWQEWSQFQNWSCLQSRAQNFSAIGIYQTPNYQSKSTEWFESRWLRDHRWMGDRRSHRRCAESKLRLMPLSYTNISEFWKWYPVSEFVTSIKTCQLNLW